MGLWQATKTRLDKLSGGWLIFIGALLWSTAGAVVKSFGVHPLFLAALRSLIAGLALAAAIRPRKIKFDKWLFLMLLSYTLIVACVIPAFRMTSATLVIAMQYTAPVWLFIASSLIHRHVEKRRLGVMLMIVLAMVIFLVEPAEGVTQLGNILALALGPLFGAMSYFMTRVQHDNTLGIVSLMNLSAAIVIMPICLLLPGINISVGSGDWPYIIYLALFQLSGGYAFYLMGVKKVTAQRATLLAVWEFILTPVWALLVVGEIPSVYVIIGAVVLLVALLLDNRIESRIAAEKQG